jgi:two-component system OmpR family response regulator
VNPPDQPRVLVVDDEPNIVDVISMALRSEGFAVEAAASGAARWPLSRRSGRT